MQQPQKRLVRVDPVDVEARLEHFHLHPSMLIRSISTGMQHAFLCTKHDPPNLPGILVWGKAVRDLRDQLIPMGWLPDNSLNYATVIHPTATMAIAVAAGDSGTGREAVTPSTRNSKGRVTRRAVDHNVAQLTLEDLLNEVEMSFPKPQDVPGFQTWYLLHFADDQEGEIRSELSLPDGMASDGHVMEWRERIILPILPLRPDSLPQHDDDEGPDIPVNRRSA